MKVPLPSYSNDILSFNPLLSLVGVFLFPVLSYALVGQLTFGLGTSSVFVAVLLMGVY